jgi:phosphatidylethanolamine/phosphatidyl-N-methylethanolamine N-methyltransferase
MRGHRVHNAAKKTPRKFGDACGDEFRFIKTWASKPLTTGAISPSGRALARQMAARINPDWPGAVIELGPGTGAVTAAILKRGVRPEQLNAIEFNTDFARHLARRFNGISVIEGDAYSLRKTLEKHGIGEIAAIVSSLPLFTRPAPQRIDLMEEAMSLLPPGRPFIQFSYALVPPVPDNPGHWTLDTSDWIFLNLPPARVWTYTKAEG